MAFHRHVLAIVSLIGAAVIHLVLRGTGVLTQACWFCEKQHEALVMSKLQGNRVTAAEAAYVPFFRSRGLEDVVRAASSVVRVRAYDVLRPWGRSHGSGFIWSKKGEIVTNMHVVMDATLLVVQFAGGEERRAKVVGGSRECDIAVLRIVDADAAPMPAQFQEPLQLGHPPRVGDRVAAVGHPGHWAWLLGDGVVSATGRHSSRLLEKMNTHGGLRRFQRHCAVDGMFMSSALGGPGSSGGPMLYVDGTVAGITTWQFSGGSYPRIMVAIDVQVLRRVVPALLADGEYRAPSAGIEGGLFPAKIAWPLRHGNAFLGLRGEGVRLLGLPGKEARAAGVRCLDELLYVGSSKVEHAADVLDAVQHASPGSELCIGFRHMGDSTATVRQAKLTVGIAPRHRWRQGLAKSARILTRAYMSAQLVREMYRKSIEMKGDSLSVLRGTGSLLTNGVVNKTLSHWVGKDVLAWSKTQALRLIRLAVDALFLNVGRICDSLLAGRACKVIPGKPDASWKPVATPQACRRKCEGHNTDATTVCCSYDLQDKTCALHMWPNSTAKLHPRGDPKHSATLCHAMRFERLSQNWGKLLGLLWGVLSDSSM